MKISIVMRMWSPRRVGGDMGRAEPGINGSACPRVRTRAAGGAPYTAATAWDTVALPHGPP